jgi:hypothetical protein
MFTGYEPIFLFLMGTSEGEYERMVKRVRAKTMCAVESVPEEIFAAVMKNLRDHQKIDSGGQERIY